MNLMIIVMSVLLLAIAVAGIAIKIIVKKDGKFSGTCASQSLYLNKEANSCSICGATPEEKCKN